MVATLNNTDFSFPNQKSVYKGKVREVYTLENDLLVAIATDRLSAFDVILPKGIPYKGQILNQIAQRMMQATSDIVPNWMLACPDPNVTIGKRCEPFKVEMVIRGYLAGHAFREYQKGKRILCGVPLPEGLKENDKLPVPIITPATKAEQGDHDEDISKDEILERGIVSPEHYALLEKYTYALFKRGTALAKERGLILVDTKYEFGLSSDNEVLLIDEIHTPDSSRYFYSEGYQERQAKGEKQQQLSKEFVRQWLIENNFQGQEGQVLPQMNDHKVQEISDRYIALYENITGDDFVPAQFEDSDIYKRIEISVVNYINSIAK